MKNFRLRIAAALPILYCAIAAHAQQLQSTDAILLKNWAAPLHWQPSRAEMAEREAAVGATPKLVFSANQLSPNALTFVAITPCRLVDTRGAAGGFSGPSPFSGPSIAPATSVNFPVQSTAETTITAPAPCGVIPSIAQAYSFNLSVIDKAGAGGFYLTVFPTGSSTFVATIVDYQAQPGVTLSNAAIVPAGTPNGGITVFNSGPGATVDVIIDMNGFYAAPSDLTGDTALGSGALVSNSTGSDNTAVGSLALQHNTAGVDNTASGFQALLFNTTGNSNTASGDAALQSNSTGNGNTAVGSGALANNTTGSSNIAVGNAAANVVAGDGSNNIHIGSSGASGDNQTIRIGTPGTQTSFFVAGVNNVNLGSDINAVGVLIDTTNGQLGVASSSRRYKEDIEDMGEASRDLMRLRPVTFRYKKPFADGSKPIQYGLIAEEVDGVYPNLVAHSGDGQIETVKYQVLDSMLLNEVQKQYQHAQLQDETIRQQQEEVLEQREQIRKLQGRLAALEVLLSAKVTTAVTAGQ